MNRGRVKVCRFCEDKVAVISYKNERVLRRFITERGKVTPRRMTGTCARHQRVLVRAIKRARHVALMPYVAEAVR